MNSIEDKEWFIIRSSSSNVNIPLQWDVNRGFNYCTVSSISIPKTFYVLPEDCTVIVTENGVGKTINMSKGNYNVSSLQSILQTAMNAACDWDYVISYPNSFTQVDTVKYLFTVSGNGGLQPSIYVENHFLAKCLGLTKQVEHIFSNNELESVNVINFQSYDQLLIKCNLCANQAQLLEEIFCAGEPFASNILFKNDDLLTNGKRIAPGYAKNQVFNFSIVSSDGEPVELNGSFWTLTLCLFRVSDIYSVIRNYIEIETLEKLKA